MQRRRTSERDVASSVDKAHGRIERRTLTSTTVLNNYLDWPGVQQICPIRRTRTMGGRTETETAYFITSVPRHLARADVLLGWSRAHWGAIENGLHYIRDEAFGEDRCTISTGHAPQNLAALRNAALNLLKRAEVPNILAKLRSFTRNPLSLLRTFGYPN